MAPKSTSINTRNRQAKAISSLTVDAELINKEFVDVSGVTGVISDCMVYSEWP